jgi:hypothetical protein
MESGIRIHNTCQVCEGHSFNLINDLFLRCRITRLQSWHSSLVRHQPYPIFLTIVVDPHHGDAEPDSTYHPDPGPAADPYTDPTFHPDADPDPDPSCQIKAHTIEKVLK